MRSPVKLTLIGLVCLVFTQGSFALDARGVYLTANLSIPSVKNSSLSDGSCSHALAYFGCGSSVDISHGTDSKGSKMLHFGGYIGVGFRVNENVRVEAVRMPSMTFPLDGHGWAQPLFSFEDHDKPTFVNARGEIDATAIAINVFYEFNALTIPAIGFVPYVGVGVGQASLDTDLRVSRNLDSASSSPDSHKTLPRREESTGFFALYIGFSKKLSDRFDWDLGWHTMNLGDAMTAEGTVRVSVWSPDPDAMIPSFDLDVGTTQLELTASGFTTGLRFRF